MVEVVVAVVERNYKSETRWMDGWEIRCGGMTQVGGVISLLRRPPLDSRCDETSRTDSNYSESHGRGVIS
jgi:allantoicase